MRWPRLPLALLLLVLAALAAPSTARAASAREKLTRVLQNARDYKQRLAAVIGLVRLGDRKAVPALIDALRDPHTTVRGTVAAALGKLGDDRAQDALEALLGRERDPFVLKSAQSALATLLGGAKKARPTEPDGLEVAGAVGTLDEQAAQDGVNARLGRAAACYMRERGEAPFIVGRLDLKFRVTTAGRVRWVRLVRSDLGSLAAERCILAELAKAKFTAPDGGEAEFSIPITLHPQAVSVASGAPPRPTGVPADARKLVKACKKMLRPGGGAASLAPPPGLLVTMYVDSDGTILSAGLSSASGGVPSEIATELVSRIKAFKLPSRDDGHVIKVVTPFGCPR